MPGGGNEEKWTQITGSISKWKNVESKVKRFYQTETDLLERDFIASQLNDTRYIAKLALDYVKQLGCDVSATKGYVVSKIRHQWGFNDLIGETDKKERTDHRHHAIDAVVIAATSPQLYKKAVSQIERNKLKIPAPYPNIRDDLAEHLKHTIISHASQRKLSGGLHEETGAGYIEKHGGLVYRKSLSPEFTAKNIKNIVDREIQELIASHLAHYNNDPKKAFADNIVVLHKDSKTPIKRVRVLQSKTTEKKLTQTKFGVKDKSGKVFKYMSYGNIHHVEIIKHKKTGKYTGQFVTMMQASHRVKGIQSLLNPNGIKQAIIKKDHGNDFEFIMALHKNDLVSIAQGDEEREFYRIQKLGGGYDLTLRLHTETSTKREKTFIENKKILENSFGNFIINYDLRLHRINAIGILSND